MAACRQIGTSLLLTYSHPWDGRASMIRCSNTNENRNVDPMRCPHRQILRCRFTRLPNRQAFEISTLLWRAQPLLIGYWGIEGPAS